MGVVSFAAANAARHSAGSGNRVGVWLANVHASDQTIVDGIYVLNHSIHQYLAAQIPNNLVDIDNAAPALIVFNMHWVDTRIDHSPLPLPISSHGIVTTDTPALHSVRPVHIWMHSGEDGIDVASVE